MRGEFVVFVFFPGLKHVFFLHLATRQLVICSLLSSFSFYIQAPLWLETSWAADGDKAGTEVVLGVQCTDRAAEAEAGALVSETICRYSCGSSCGSVFSWFGFDRVNSNKNRLS